MAGSFLYLFMAIYHLHAGFVSRSTGRSAVQAAAYISGAVLLETRRNLVANYSRTSNVEFSLTLAPHAAPDFAKDLNVWDLLENYEDSYAASRYKSEETLLKYKNSARIAQTIVIALPKELEPSVWKEIVIDFAKERFVSRGLVVSMAIHNDEGNPHAHFQISRRAIDENGQWSKTKDREITTRSSLIETRKMCAKIINKYLEREGLNERVDHRSFVDLGIPFEASRHEGWYAQRLKYTGRDSRIVQENLDIKSGNKELASLQPETILQEITVKQATFSTSDLAKVVQNRLTDDLQLASKVYDACLQKAVLVGSDLEGNARYSSANYVDTENQAFDLAASLIKQSIVSIDQNLRDRVLAQEQYTKLNDEQKSAVNLLTANNQLAMMIGRAGTGKTTTLRAVVEIHKQANYEVLGLALSANAAENLQLEAGCSAETVAFYCDKWQRLDAANEAYWTMHASSDHPRLEAQVNYLKPYALTSKHLVIVDEAGMIGTRQWQILQHYVNEAGAKLIATGDDHQAKAIEGGDFFRGLKEVLAKNGKLCKLETIFRQKEAWMIEASCNLAELKTYQALAAYENHGLVKELASISSGLPVIAKHYLEQTLSNPDKSGLLLAYTRAECDQLNEQVRLLFKEKNLIGSVDLKIGGKNFSERDQIVFLKNDREKKITTFCTADLSQPVDFLIKNGTRGEIVDIKETPAQNDNHKLSKSYEVTVKVNDWYAKFNTEEYNHVAHGYASTIHKAQGKTVDWSIILGSRYMGAFAIYVALTRHRDLATLYYAKDTFADFSGLQKSLARLSNKDLAVDYTINPQNYDYWENVQEYKLLGQDLIATAKENNWENYNALKSEQIAIGKTILANWEEHQVFAKQAGFTSESIAINCGLKARPLSLAELGSQDTVKLYLDLATEARGLWRSIKQTHPGPGCYEHPSYQDFIKLRMERNQLAKTIIDNKALYKEWLVKARIYGWKALEAQAKQGSSMGLNIMPLAKPYKHEKISIRQVAPADVKLELQQKITSLASSLLGEPDSHNAREWRYGQKGSISINVSGVKQGLYANFEAGSYGGPLKLIQDQLNLDHIAAYKWALNWLGHSSKIQKTATIEKATAKANIVWTPVFPVPKEYHDPKLTDHSLSYQLIKNNRHEVARFAYKDLEGNLLGYTVRLENQKGDKIVLPLTYCQNSYGKREWRWHGFGGNRSLYGLDKLSKDPDKAILIVEGEKTADAAQKILPDFSVISWSGGAAAVNKTDFLPIIDKNIILWPDNDKAGITAMHQISQQLISLGAYIKNIRQIQLPSNTPAKWDLADPVPDNWGTSIRELIATSTYVLSNTLEKTDDLSQSIKDVEIAKATREKNLLIELKISDEYFKYHIVDSKTTVVGRMGSPSRLPDGRKMHLVVDNSFSDQLHLIPYKDELHLKFEHGTKLVINTDEQGSIESFNRYSDLKAEDLAKLNNYILARDQEILAKREQQKQNRLLETELNRFGSVKHQIIDHETIVIGWIGLSANLSDGRKMHEISENEDFTRVKLVQYDPNLDPSLKFGDKVVIKTDENGSIEKCNRYSDLKGEELVKIENYALQENDKAVGSNNLADHKDQPINLPAEVSLKADLLGQALDQHDSNIIDLIARSLRELPSTVEKIDYLDQELIKDLQHKIECRENNRSIEREISDEYFKYHIVDNETTIVGRMGSPSRLSDGRKMHLIVDSSVSDQVHLIPYTDELHLKFEHGTELVINTDKQGLIESFNRYSDLKGEDLAKVNNYILERDQERLAKREQQEAIQKQNRLLEIRLNGFGSEKYQIIDQETIVVGLIGLSTNLSDGRKMHEILENESFTRVKLVQYDPNLDTKLKFGERVVIKTDENGSIEKFDRYSNIKGEDLVKLENYILQENNKNIERNNRVESQKEKNIKIQNVLSSLGDWKFEIVDRKENIVGLIGLPETLPDGREMHQIYIHSANIIKLIEYNNEVSKELKYGSKVFIATDEQGKVASFDEYCNVERENSKEFINQVLEKYDLSYWAGELKPQTFANIKETYRQMVDWNKYINNKINSTDKKHLLEKAIIAEVLTKHAQKLCANETLFNKHIGAKQISLIGAKIIQENWLNKKTQMLTTVLEQSHNEYNKQEQQKVYEISRLEIFHPQSPELQRTALINQKYLCINMINKDLPTETEKNIIETIKSLAQTTDYKETKLTLYRASNQEKSIKPETYKTIERILEFKFMEQVRQKTNSLDQDKQLNMEKMLTVARNVALQLHNEMLRQHLLELQRQRDRGIER